MNLFSTFGSAGIEVVDSEQKYREDKLLDRTGEGAEELELDLTPGALDKTNDPVRMYLREMGTVPLLTREGEVEIAKRIERGKLAVIKSISRTPTIAKLVIHMGDQLKSGERTIRELVIFNDEELTDERIEERSKEVGKQIEAVRRAWQVVEKANEKLADTPRGVTTRERRRYRRVRWAALRARVELSQLIRRIEFTESVKRRMIDQSQDLRRGRPASPAGSGRDRAAAQSQGPQGPDEGGRSPGTSSRNRKICAGASRRSPTSCRRRRSSCCGLLRRSIAAKRKSSRRRRRWSRPTSGWSCRSPRGTPIADSSSSI